MVEVMKWDLTALAELGRLDLSMLLESDTESKEFLLCVHTDRQPEFVDANPEFVVSESLKVPYCYVRRTDHAPHIASIGAISVPSGTRSLRLVARPWSKSAKPVSEVFSVAVVSAPAGKNPRVEHLLPGVKESVR